MNMLQASGLASAGMLFGAFLRLRVMAPLLVFLSFLVAPPTVWASETVKFLHHDHLGSPVAMTNSSGLVEVEIECSAWGAGQDDETSVLGFTGRVSTPELPLIYAKARYYDADIARFFSHDAVKPTISSPILFNRYAYANNNPIRYYDPDGNLGWVALFFIGAGTGGAVNGGMYAYNTDNFSGGEFARKTAVGAAVGGPTALLPGGLALTGVSTPVKVMAGGAGAATLGATGEAADQIIAGEELNIQDMAVSGVANLAGLAAGRALQAPARAVTTEVIKGSPGYVVRSLSGRQFRIGHKPTQINPNEGAQQFIQDLLGASTAAALDNALGGGAE